MHAENADLGWREFIKCQGELMSDVRSGARSIVISSSAMWCQEWERDRRQHRDDTQGNVMQGTQGRQGRGVAAARMWTGGETIKVTRISLRCPLHRSGITAADISQASLDTCVSVSPSSLSHYNIPSRVLSSLPQSRSREETETAAGHPAGSPETFSLSSPLSWSWHFSLCCIPGSCPAAWGHSARVMMRAWMLPIDQILDWPLSNGKVENSVFIAFKMKKY